MKLKFANSKLEYLDNILYFLGQSAGKYLDEGKIMAEVNYDKVQNVFGQRTSPRMDIPKGLERAYLTTACNYLISLDLISENLSPTDHSEYMITFKGLEIIERGGLSRENKRENYKYYVTITLAVIAFTTFGVNTVYQIANYNKNSKSTYSIYTQSVLLQAEKSKPILLSDQKTKVNPKK